MRQQKVLGAALREWRKRRPPASFGLDVQPCRRTLGLGREELAQLAGCHRTTSSSWSRGTDGDRVVVDHPDAGSVTVDSDILTIHDGDLRAVMFSAEPGSPHARQLAATGLGFHEGSG